MGEKVQRNYVTVKDLKRFGIELAKPPPDTHTVDYPPPRKATDVDEIRKGFTKFLGSDDAFVRFMRMFNKICNAFGITDPVHKLALLNQLFSDLDTMRAIYSRIMGNKSFRQKHIKGSSKDVSSIILASFLSQYLTGVPAQLLIAMSIEESGMKCNISNRTGSYGPFQISTGGPEVEFTSEYAKKNRASHNHRVRTITKLIYINTQKQRGIDFKGRYNLPLRSRMGRKYRRYLIQLYAKDSKGRVYNPMNVFKNPYLSAITASFILYANWGIAYKRGVVKNRYPDFSNSSDLGIALLLYNIGGNASRRNKKVWARGEAYSKKVSDLMNGSGKENPNLFSTLLPSKNSKKISRKVIPTKK